MLTTQQTFPSSNQPPVGMSDEEELRRLGVQLRESEGVGEVLVELEDDIAELGLSVEP